MHVKNLNGTAQYRCNCGDWYTHWRKFSGQIANRCVVIGCNSIDLVGGHVQRENHHDSSWYVIPICRACNGRRGQSLNIFDKCKLVSANVSNTCG